MAFCQDGNANPRHTGAVMSIQAVAWALEQYIPKAIAKLVLVSLANHADHASGRCYPSVEQAAHEASCSVRSVQRYTPYLAERGFIKIEEHFKDGRQWPARIVGRRLSICLIWAGVFPRTS